MLAGTVAVAGSCVAVGTAVCVGAALTVGACVAVGMLVAIICVAEGKARMGVMLPQAHSQSIIKMLGIWRTEIVFLD